MSGDGVLSNGMQPADERTASWIERARTVHGDAYDYTETVYLTSHGKVRIHCRSHGPFDQQAKSHLSGVGCKLCATERRPMPVECTASWIERAVAVHGSKYDYSLTKYINTRTKLTIICPTHGQFSQKPTSHLSGHGCQSCAREASAKLTKSNWDKDDFRNRVTEAIAAGWSDPALKKRGSEVARKRWSTADYRGKLAVARSNMPSISSLNTAVASLLDELGISYKLEHPIGPWNFDVFIQSHNLLIECHGEYWHSLPRSIRNDKSKSTYVQKYFPELKLLTIWEVEFYKEGRLREILLKSLGLSPPANNAVDFADLAIGGTDRKTAEVFCGLYHYLGSLRGSTHYGLSINGTMIGVCSFGPFVRNEQTRKYGDAVELTRFCLHPDYQVKNLGSWFLSRCLRLVNKTVVTYADTTLGHDGSLYKATNFEKLHVVDADYYYSDSNGWIMHKRTVWGRATKMGMTESEYAEKHALKKKWGGEKLCFIYRKH